MGESTMMLLIIGVLVYFVVLRPKTDLAAPTNPTQNPNGGQQQVTNQNEFDRIMALIKMGADSVTNIVQQANVSTQRN